MPTAQTDTAGPRPLLARARSARLGLIITLLLLAFAVQAQQFRGPPQGGPQGGPQANRQNDPQGMGQDGRQGGRRGPGADGERRGPPPLPTAELKRLLSLNDTQAKAVEEILQQQHAQMRQFHERSREQQQAIASGTDARLRKVLSEQQIGVFKQWREAHRPPPPGGMPPEGRRGADGGGQAGRDREGGLPPRR